MPSYSDLLIIFYKNPVIGKVKTRLATALGHPAALRIYQKLTKKLVATTWDLPLDKMVFYSTFIETEDAWDNRVFMKALQHGEDLGIRMKNAMAQGLNLGYDKVCLVGTDIYDMTSEVLTEAFEQLNNHEVVIGPAHDGGYYLIGMKNLVPSLFYDQKWGSNTVLQSTLDRLSQEKKTVYPLAVLKDIDRPQDLEGTDLI